MEWFQDGSPWGFPDLSHLAPPPAAGGGVLATSGGPPARTVVTLSEAESARRRAGGAVPTTMREGLLVQMGQESSSRGRALGRLGRAQTRVQRKKDTFNDGTPVHSVFIIMARRLSGEAHAGAGGLHECAGARR